MDGGTVHSTALNLIPAVIAVDLVLEFFIWVGDLADLVFFIDEVAVGGGLGLWFIDCRAIDDDLPQFFQVCGEDRVSREIFSAEDKHLIGQMGRDEVVMKCGKG